MFACWVKKRCRGRGVLVHSVSQTFVPCSWRSRGWVSWIFPHPLVSSFMVQQCKYWRCCCSTMPAFFRHLDWFGLFTHMDTRGFEDDSERHSFCSDGLLLSLGVPVWVRECESVCGRASLSLFLSLCPSLAIETCGLLVTVKYSFECKRKWGKSSTTARKRCLLVHTECWCWRLGGKFSLFKSWWT